jgi:hypothetical protein
MWFVAVGGGVVSGLLGIHGLAFLHAGVTLVWLAVTIALGLAAGTRSAKAFRLGAYGFVTGFAFMCFGYEGTASLASRFGPFAIIGLFCAVGAIVVGAVVHAVRGRRGRLSTN